MKIEELVMLAKAGDTAAQNKIFESFAGTVSRLSSHVFFRGADKDDVEQIAMLALYESVKSFDPERGIPFVSFAVRCIKNRLTSGIKAFSRNKHRPLNDYISLYLTSDDDSYVADSFAASGSDPLDILIEREECEDILTTAKQKLSRFESSVLEQYLFYQSYADVARELGVEVKSVDNAMQRIRKKLTA